ncbi:MAG: hypothetical protein JJU36_04225 [Phycisphaeraceae bacterium]|nr:hypothetical protein [Phycisphaeraceae bacterium]
MSFQWLTRRALVTRTLSLLGLGAIAGIKAGCDRSESCPPREVPQAFRYDITQLAADDGGLPHFQSIRSVQTGLIGAAALTAAPGGTLAVAHDQEVIVLDPVGDIVRRWSTDHRVLAVHVTDDQSVLIADTRHVHLHNPAGRRLESWMVGNERARLTGIAAAGDDLFVADAGNRTVSRYRGGDRVWQLEGFHVPSPYFDLAIGPDNLLWVAHTGRQRLEAYNHTADLIRSWGEAGFAITGFSGCCNPCHFALLSDGRFITAEKGLHRVKLHDADGKAIALVINASALGIDVNKPVGIAEQQNRVSPGPLVAGLGQDRVAVLHPRNGGLHILQAPDEVS